MIFTLFAFGDESDSLFLEGIYNRFGSQMYNSAYRILESRQDAEDAVQDTLIKIYGNAEKFKSLSEDDLILLIIVYTRNTARDILRRRGTVLKNTVDTAIVNDDGDEEEIDLPDTSADVSEIAEKEESAREMARLIASLPEAQRDAIILRYRYDMSEREIATVLGISETAVSSRILRAKNKLRVMLSGWKP